MMRGLYREMQINLSILKSSINNRNIKIKENNSSPFLMISRFNLKKDVFQKSDINFKGSKGKESNFEVKKILNLRCPVCSRIMLNSEQQEAFSSDIASKRGKELVNALEFYEDERNITNDWSAEKRSIFSEQRQGVVDKIKPPAIENPTLNIQEIINLEGKECLKNLIATQMKVIAELEKYASRNIESEVELLYFKNIIEEYKERIWGVLDTPFKRQQFLHDISGVCSRRKVQHNINDIAQKMPTSTNDVSSFFVKYASEKNSPKKAASKLFCRNTPTAEHLHPKIRGGKNSIKNYICDCVDCNEKKGDSYFYDWQKTIPDFDIKLQQYIENVNDAIKRGDLPQNYINYLMQLPDTILRLSNGKIKLEPPSAEL